MSTENQSTSIGSNNKTVLVLFSGGLDSAYMLYHYLVKTKYKIHCHHVSLRNRLEPRWPQEDAATNKIYRICKRYRNFDKSSSSFEFFDFQDHIGWDTELCMMMGQRVAPNLDGKKVYIAIGFNKHSFVRADVRVRFNRDVYNKLWQALINSYYPEIKQRICPKIQYPLADMTKKQIIDACPPDILSASWSCRTPKKKAHGWIPCRKCHACHQRSGK